MAVIHQPAFPCRLAESENLSPVYADYRPRQRSQNHHAQQLLRRRVTQPIVPIPAHPAADPPHSGIETVSRNHEFTAADISSAHDDLHIARVHGSYRQPAQSHDFERCNVAVRTPGAPHPHLMPDEIQMRLGQDPQRRRPGCWRPDDAAPQDSTPANFSRWRRFCWA